MVYKFFDKKNASLAWSETLTMQDKPASGGAVKNENIPNQHLSEELHQPIIRKSKKPKVHSSFIDNIWGTVLGDMQLISKFNKGFQFALGVIDIYGKYASVVCLKVKKSITITKGF